MAKSKKQENEVKVVDEVTVEETVEVVDSVEVKEEVKKQPKTSGEITLISMNQRNVTYSINGEIKTKPVNRVEHRQVLTGNYSCLN